MQQDMNSLLSCLGPNLFQSLCRFSSPAKAASGEGEDEKLDELRALMSTMVQQMQQLPDVINPSMARSASFGERPT